MHSQQKKKKRITVFSHIYYAIGHHTVLRSTYFTSSETACDKIRKRPIVGCLNIEL